MEKLPMCRICLVKDVPMYVVLNRNLQELYEKLTDIPFVTEDTRPTLACFFCCTKLKQCYRLLRQCLEAEELLSQMMNDDYEPNSSMNQDHLGFYSGLVKSPIVHISIVDVCQIESIAMNEELPVVCEGLGEMIEPKKEHQSEELEPGHFDNSCLDVADIPPHHSELDSEDNVFLMEFKTEVVEEPEVSKKKQRATSTKSTTVANKPKLDTRRIKLEDAITAEQTKNEKPVSKFIRTQKRTSIPGIYLKEPDKCDQHSFNRVKKQVQHTLTQIGEKPYKCDVCQRRFDRKSHFAIHIRKHTGEKPYKCDLCQRSFSQNGELTKHIRIHTGEKPYKCDVCQRSFCYKNNLTEHLRIHTGEKRHKCDVCDRSFCQKGVLTKHIRTHTGEKPYKCDVCHRSFNQSTHLTNHIRIHTGEKPFQCHICQRSFGVKSHLLRHVRIHSG